MTNTPPKGFLGMPQYVWLPLQILFWLIMSVFLLWEFEPAVLTQTPHAWIGFGSMAALNVLVFFLLRKVHRKNVELQVLEESAAPE